MILTSKRTVAMKIFETKIMCMKEKEITANSSKGYPSKIYPNSGIEGYHDFFEFEYFLLILKYIS